MPEFSISWISFIDSIESYTIESLSELVFFDFSVNAEWIRLEMPIPSAIWWMIKLCIRATLYKWGFPVGMITYIPRKTRIQKGLK